MKKKMLAIIQARMGSSRLPGKALKKANGTALMDYLFMRLKKSRLVDGFLLAVPTGAADDALEAYAHDNHIPCFRGSPVNVAQRFAEALRAEAPEAFVRISADSPMLDAALVDEVVRLYQNAGCDLATNIGRRCYPKGQSVEVMRAETYLGAYPSFNQAEHLEHVTSYFYEKPDKFKIAFLPNPKGDQSRENLSIDTEEDLRRFELLLSRLRGPFADTGWREFLALSHELSGARS